MKKSNQKNYNANFNEDAHIPSQDFEPGLDAGEFSAFPQFLPPVSHMTINRRVRVRVRLG